MARNFQPGDDLIFQIESGFGLIRVLAIDETESGDAVWHLLAYQNLFLDGETAEKALQIPNNLKVWKSHIALTNRAFESTQTAKLLNRPVSNEEIEPYLEWKKNPESQVSDRSVLLMLGLR